MREERSICQGQTAKLLDWGGVQREAVDSAGGLETAASGDDWRA